MGPSNITNFCGSLRLLVRGQELSCHFKLYFTKTLTVIRQSKPFGNDKEVNTHKASILVCFCFLKFSRICLINQVSNKKQCSNKKANVCFSN